MGGHLILFLPEHRKMSQSKGAGLAPDCVPCDDCWGSLGIVVKLTSMLIYAIESGQRGIGCSSVSEPLLICGNTHWQQTVLHTSCRFALHAQTSIRGHAPLPVFRKAPCFLQQCCDQLFVICDTAFTLHLLNIPHLFYIEHVQTAWLQQAWWQWHSGMFQNCCTVPSS